MPAVIPLHPLACLSVFVPSISLALSTAEEGFVTRRTLDQGLAVRLPGIPTAKTELDLQLGRRLGKISEDIGPSYTIAEVEVHCFLENLY